MEVAPGPSGARPRWRRPIGALVVAVVALVLAGCDPAPPPDGRDLGVVVLAAPTELAPGEQATVTAEVTNHGDTTAGAVSLGYLSPTVLTVDSVTGSQVTGCIQQGVIGACRLGDLPPGAARTVQLAVTATSVGSHRELLLAVGSGGTEPNPDPHVNSTVVPISVERALRFGPAVTVAAGEVFDVTGVAATDVAFPATFISISLPPNIEAISASIGASTTPCTPTGSCDGFLGVGIGNGSVVSMRLRAVSPGPPAGVVLSISAIGGTISGGPMVQVVDPAITSEVHPELAPVADGIVGAPQDLSGTVWNAGSTDHAMVTATFDVPASLQVDAASWGPDGLPCTIDGTTTTCAVGEVPSYGSVTVTVTVTPLTAGSATVTMETTTTQAQDDPDPFPDTDSASFAVTDDFVDLGLGATPSDPPVDGVAWAYLPTITNHGTVAAVGTRLEVTMPAGIVITGVPYITAPRPADYAGCTVDGQVVTCEVGTVPPGRSFIAQIQSAVTEGTAGTVEASVSSDRSEPIPDLHPNDLAQTISVAAAHADLRARIINPPAEVVVGQPVTFAHQIINDGPSRAPDSVLTFAVPSGWTITAATWSDFGVDVPCTIVGSTSTCEPGPIIAGGRPTARVTVVPDQVGADLVLTATAASTLADLDPSNNEATHVVDVIPA